MMRLLENSLDTGAENLAFDEVMLDAVEQGQVPDTLRIWECPQPFVVVGTGQVLLREVKIEQCRDDGIEVMRRCSAGGCVLQGPGCLNFALALQYENFPEVKSLHNSYRFILSRIIQAFENRDIVLCHQGASDLAHTDGRKISGNAQRRRRRAMLHHGTLLYKVNREAMTRYLHEPDDRPEYRGARSHESFVGQVDLSRGQLTGLLEEAFDAKQPAVMASPREQEEAAQLARTKYMSPAWISRR
jgi:lipoate-protein ligase A